MTWNVFPNSTCHIMSDVHLFIAFVLSLSWEKCPCALVCRGGSLRHWYLEILTWAVGERVKKLGPWIKLDVPEYRLWVYFKYLQMVIWRGNLFVMYWWIEGCSMPFPIQTNPSASIFHVISLVVRFWLSFPTIFGYHLYLQRPHFLILFVSGEAEILDFYPNSLVWSSGCVS